MKSVGTSDPVFEVIGNLFKVTLFPVKTGVNGGVNELLEYIQSNPGKKTADLKTVFNLPQRTLERWLKQLFSLFYRCQKISRNHARLFPGIPKQ